MYSTLEYLADDSAAASAHLLLATLNSYQIQVIDAIISRCPSATSFLTVFQTYNDMLEELGLDADDVVYYKFLLKLGVLKGLTWGEKWSFAKQQHGHSSLSLSQPLVPPDSTMDVSYSHPELESKRDRARPKSIVLGQHEILIKSKTAKPSGVQNPRGSDDVDWSIAPQRKAFRRQSHKSTSSPVFVDAQTQLPTAGSRSLEYDGVSAMPDPVIRRKHQAATSHHNEIWETIKSARDIPVASTFRDRNLLVRCFDVWRGGLQWIQTTEGQVSTARSHIETQICFYKWRHIFKLLRFVDKHAMKLASETLLRGCFKAWTLKQQDCIRQRREERMAKALTEYQVLIRRQLPKVAWRRWQQAYHGSAMLRRHNSSLCLRALQVWKYRRSSLIALETRMLLYQRGLQRHLIRECLNRWKQFGRLRSGERIFTLEMSQNTCRQVLSVWSALSSGTRALLDFRYHRLNRKFFTLWLTRRRRNQIMIRQADSFRVQSDMDILRNSLCSWISREREELLCQVRSLRRKRIYLKLWRSRRQKCCVQRDLALQLAGLIDRSMITTVFQSWQQHLQGIRRRQQTANEYHALRVRDCALYSWRLRLRINVKALKQSSVALRYFTQRSAWKQWCESIRLRSLNTLEVAFEQKTSRSILHFWVRRTRETRYIRRATAFLHQRRAKRITKDCLRCWTHRVVEVKLRELITTERNTSKSIKKSFSIWKSAFRQQQEYLSLMDSFCIVQQEDFARRHFVFWLTSMRRTRIRRLRLESHQTYANQQAIVHIWEQWRGRYTEEQLRSTELEVIRRCRNNLIFHAFLVWQRETYSLPALRMHLNRMKSRAWQSWKSVLPNALRRRKARDLDKFKCLQTAFQKWTEAHENQRLIRSNARDRFLRYKHTHQTLSVAATGGM